MTVIDPVAQLLHAACERTGRWTASRSDNSGDRVLSVISESEGQTEQFLVAITRLPVRGGADGVQILIKDSSGTISLVAADVVDGHVTIRVDYASFDRSRTRMMCQALEVADDLSTLI